MSKILAKKREIVSPGTLLAKGMDFLPGTGTYREEEKIYSNRVGLVSKKDRVVKLIPLGGKYMPKEGDEVIGKVKDMLFSGWVMDIGAPYDAILSVGEATEERIDLREGDLANYFDIGDLVFGKIINVTKSKDVQLSLTKEDDSRKLEEGHLIKISPTKVPRVIGKGGSMIKMIKGETDCDILVGQNGYIHISGEAEGIYNATRAIKKIAEKSHISGLTDKIENLLKNE